MNAQLIYKEWKEKAAVPLFALAFLLIFVVATFVFSQQGEILDYLAGSILLVFLPMTALLIGASAFSVEFRDGAWAYLFSRPVKKAVIWFSKFLALGAYLAVLLLLYGLILPRIPGIREKLADLSLWELSVVLSVTVFVIAFSLSFLTDRQFQTIFLSLLLFAGLGAVSMVLWISLLSGHPHLMFLTPVVWTLVVVSVGASSLIAFCRADFSQPRAKVISFLKSMALSLVVAVVCVLAATWIGGRWTRTTHLFVEPAGTEAAIFSNRGFYRYDAERDKLKRLSGELNEWGGGSVDGGKVVWVKDILIHKGGVRKWATELWIMDEDGRNKRPLLRPAELIDSRFTGQFISYCQISRDGSRVIFISRTEGNRSRMMVWSLNSDGTKLKSYPIDVPDTEWLDCRGWSADGRSVILYALEKSQDKNGWKRRSRLLKLSIESGAWQVIADQASGVCRFGLSPQGTRLGVFDSEDVLALYDLESLEKTDLLRIPGVRSFRWNREGDKALFLADGNPRIGIVSLTEKRILAEKALADRKKPRLPGSLDWAGPWAAGGQKIVLSDFDGRRYALRVFDDTLKEDRVYPLPQGETLDNFPAVFGLGRKVLVLDFVSSRLWAFDLATKKWRKLF